ncbi:MAG: metallopeptidase family protein [Myxococcota bacterium]|nr:metallopeptidase family protein [Myxococcota bacterium]
MFTGTNRLLDDAWAALDAGKVTRARSLARRAVRDSDRALRCEAYHILGRAALEAGDPEEAMAFLAKSLAPSYDTADLHYDLGLAYELLGNDHARRAEFLKVWDLDASTVTEHILEEERLVQIAEQTLLELPPHMLQLLRQAPIFVEDRPDRYLVEEHLDPRLLGLFEGPPWSEQGLHGPALTRILLYRTNIEAVCRNLGEAEKQVRLTLLHETAHFFGLEEDELESLGLA